MSDGEDFLFADFEIEAPQVKTVEKFSYNAKVCDPEWFLAADRPVDAGDAMTVFKYTADHMFMKKHYQDAYEQYQKIIKMASPKVISLKLDVVESQIRCLVNMPHPPTDPVQLAQSTLESCKTDNHMMNYLFLLQYVYEKLDMVQDEIIILQKCLAVHYSNADLWIKLAKAYKRLFRLDKSSDAAVQQLKKLEITKIPSEKTSSAGDTGFEKTQEGIVVDGTRIQMNDMTGNDAMIDLCNDVRTCTDKHVSYLSEVKDTRTDLGPLCSAGGGETSSASSGANNHTTACGVEVDSGTCLGDSTIEGARLWTGMPAVVVVLVCLLKSRRLLYSLRNLVGLAVQKNTQQQELVQSEIKGLDVPEHISQVIQKSLQPDLTCFKEKVSEITMSTLRDMELKEEFERIWFSWPKLVESDVDLTESSESL